MRAAIATALAAIAAVVANLLLRAVVVAVFDIPQPEFASRCRPARSPSRRSAE
jgi:hypothetical protein